MSRMGREGWAEILFIKVMRIAKWNRDSRRALHQLLALSDEILLNINNISYVTSFFLSALLESHLPGKIAIRNVHVSSITVYLTPLYPTRAAPDFWLMARSILNYSLQHWRAKLKKKMSKIDQQQSQNLTFLETLIEQISNAVYHAKAYPTGYENISTTK